MLAACRVAEVADALIIPLRWPSNPKPVISVAALTPTETIVSAALWFNVVIT